MWKEKLISMNRDPRKQLLLEQYLDYDYLKEQYRNGELPGLNSYERELLEFCHNRDMREYLRENVWEKPIVLNSEGHIDWEKTKYRSEEQNKKQVTPENYTYPQQEYQPTPYPQHPQQIQPSAQPFNEQKFYYLYDDEGNLIAALPKK